MNQAYELGQWGENQAALYLKSIGHKILERNWRKGKAELDIISEEENILVITEVKTLSNEHHQRPSEQIGVKKERLLTEAANAYIEQNQINNECRFDVIEIVRSSMNLRHIKDAFRARI